MLRNTLFAAPILIGLALASAPSRAQEERHPPAEPADVASLEAIVAAMYDVTSGPAGDRDWKRFESLFVEEIGRFTPIAPGGTHVESWTPRDYQARFGAFYSQNASYARELSRRVERFGHLAHVFSTFGIFDEPDSKEPLQRGINSIQLFFGGGRWWIVSVAWDAETEEQPLPAKYLE